MASRRAAAREHLQGVVNGVLGYAYVKRPVRLLHSAPIVQEVAAEIMALHCLLGAIDKKFWHIQVYLGVAANTTLYHLIRVNRDVPVTFNASRTS